jgi:ethanolamine ammonia-lyase small subunit
MRPDLGRRLAPEAEERLRTLALSAAADLAVVVADGLSARAVERHAVPVLAQLLPALRAEAWRIAPLCLVRHGRVAIGDAVAAALGTTAVLVLIGERPGLSAPDSMGAYMTWRPRPGTTDAERNCISNIRPDGLGYGEAAYRIAFLFGRMRASNASGVALKDESGGTPAITGPIT